MSGTSIPEDALDFYKPLMIWLDKYCENPAPVTKLTFQMDYINTSSSKFIFEIILKLDKAARERKTIAEIIWKHEADDDGIIDAGESFKQNVSIPFRFEIFQDNR